jgi:hypothetical protein
MTKTAETGLVEALEPFARLYNQIIADHGVEWFAEEGQVMRASLAYPVALSAVVWRHFRLAAEALAAAPPCPDRSEVGETNDNSHPAEVKALLAVAREQQVRAESAEAQLAEAKAEIERQRNRGDNHWETLRSIRDLARQGDCAAIIQYVSDAGTGYVETSAETMASMQAAITTLTAQLAKLVEAGKAFAAVAAVDIGEDETDADIFQPIHGKYKGLIYLTPSENEGIYLLVIA